MTPDTQQLVAELNAQISALYQPRRFQKGLQVAIQALELAEQLGEEHPLYTTTLNSVAVIAQALGRN